MSFYTHLIIYLLAFTAIWIGSGLAVKSVDRLARALGLSSFVVSFVVLGMFTSISEFSVGVNALLEHDPEIFVGNLIGASIVIFMLLIPLLAMVGKSIRITPEFRGFNLPASLVVISLPVLLSIDGVITQLDALICLGSFGALVAGLQIKSGVLDRIKQVINRSAVKVGKEVIKIVVGVGIIFFASHSVVTETLYFSAFFNMSPFFISLLVIALGTNIPELSLVIRSIMLRNHQIAFGDYIGSAAFNTMLLAGLTLANRSAVVLTNSYVVSLLFLIVGLVMFYYFARTKNVLSRWEGSILFLLYVGFVMTEVFLHT